MTNKEEKKLRKLWDKFCEEYKKDMGGAVSWFLGELKGFINKLLEKTRQEEKTLCEKKLREQRRKLLKELDK